MSLVSNVFLNPETGERYEDKKRYLWTFSLVYPYLPGIFIALAYATGQPAWLWAFPLAFYALVPVLDHITGEDENNPPDWAIAQMEEDPFYRKTIYWAIPGLFVNVAIGAWAFTSGLFPAWALAGLIASVGIVGVFGLNIGHELGHKKNEFERWLGKLADCVIGYGHFYIEHNKGHHRDVATPEDPASSRMGENLYRFGMREIPGAARRAWRIEVERLQRKGSPVFSLENEIVQTTLMTAALWGVLTLTFGWAALPFLVAQGAIGWFHLTLANYVEHYGLLRQKQENGRYERCKPEHSWNTNHIFSNLILFHLQRHSDHHANPTRRYQALREFHDSPQLPSGYPGVWLMAMVPPIWRMVMDKKLLEHVGYDMNKVNIAPDKREQLIARYHHPELAAPPGQSKAA